MKEMKKTILFAGVLLFTLMFAQIGLVLATVYDNSAYETSYAPQKIPTGERSDVIVSVLKYEPYPVIAGQWFDLWVKVQNVGQNSANNLTFQLIPEYPFAVDNNLTRNYGILYGTQAAYKVDQTYDATQLILKYRVKTAENAPSGISNLKLKIIPDASNPAVAAKETDLPIEIFSSTNVPAESNSANIEDSTSIFYGVIGFIIGVFLILIIWILKNRKKSVSH